MSGKKTVIGDEMINAQLKANSEKLNISIDELIEWYVRRGLFTDDYWEPPEITIEELRKINKIELEREKKMGLKPPKKHRFDVFVNRWSEDDE